MFVFRYILLLENFHSFIFAVLILILGRCVSFIHMRTREINF